MRTPKVAEGRPLAWQNARVCVYLSRNKRKHTKKPPKVARICTDSSRPKLQHMKQVQEHLQAPKRRRFRVGQLGSRFSPNGRRCSRLRLAFDDPGQMISAHSLCPWLWPMGRSTSAGLLCCCVESYGSLQASRFGRKTRHEIATVCG
jgi:hypothetical protein